MNININKQIFKYWILLEYLHTIFFRKIMETLINKKILKNKKNIIILNKNINNDGLKCEIKFDYYL